MIEQDKLLGTGGTSDVYEWQDGEVLKLFRKRHRYHPHEITATRAAHRVGLPVPAVVGTDLVEVDGREGIVFERIDGLTIPRYLDAHPDEVAECARAMAALHAEIHMRTAPVTLIAQRQVLESAIGRVEVLAPKTKDVILKVLDHYDVSRRLPCWQPYDVRSRYGCH